MSAADRFAAAVDAAIARLGGAPGVGPAVGLHGNRRVEVPAADGPARWPPPVPLAVRPEVQPERPVVIRPAAGPLPRREGPVPAQPQPPEPPKPSGFFRALLGRLGLRR